jgi:serine/threonine protein kinase
MADFLRGRYVAVRFLGSGSMGRVWLARPAHDPGTAVVVKVMHAAAASRRSFASEAQSLARLRHPYIVRLIDADGDDPAGPCLVMEYIPGVTLEAYLDRSGRLSVGHAGLLLGCLCHALDAAHKLGVVHQDLKPANLMLVGAGTLEQSLRVMDFGLARVGGRLHLTAERLAGAGHVLAQGTPAFISPEQLRGDEVDARSDIYSAGVILYQMLTGGLPFPYDDVPRLLQAHLRKAPLSFGLVGVRDVPPAVENVARSCLAKYGAERPQSARELADRFGEAIGIDVWEATRPETPPEPAPAPAPPPKLDPAEERHAIVRRLDAWMPERIAVVKVRGFLESVGGKVVESEPGLLRIRLGGPADKTPGRKQALVGLDSLPVEIALRMEKPDPARNVLSVTVLFRPFTDPWLLQAPEWRKRCDFLYKDLQSYLMAR